MLHVSIIIGALVVSSFIAAFLAVRLFGRVEPLTDEQRTRLELDRLLDQLGLADLQGVVRVSRQLAQRRRSVVEEERCFEGHTT